MTQPVPEPYHADAAPGPRRAPLSVAAKPYGHDYGYVHGGAHPSTREDLVARLREGRPTPLVWTPETDAIVPPWTVPYLFEAYREHGLRHSRKVALTWLAVSLALLGWAAVIGTFEFVNGFVIVGLLAASLSFYALLEWVRFRRLTPDKLTVEVRERHNRLPPRRGPARWTQVLAGGIGLVVLVQAVAAVTVGRGSPVLLGSEANIPSIEVAGVMKDAIRTQGEYWRLLTGAFLHDGLLHFAFNLLGLLALGRFLEGYAHRAYVPLVFLLTALASSTASYLGTGVDSVGASGGVLGMFGFLAPMARVRRDKLPPGFGRAILADIAVIAMIGIVGAGQVDNWAHAGGFVSGAALGWLMIPRGGRTPYWEPSPAIRTLGTAALAILVLGTLATAVLLVARLFIFPG